MGNIGDEEELIGSLFSSVSIFHNTDVLDVLASLSADELFTPPDVVNDMLDSLPGWVWHDPELRWLNPAVKEGAFLREIAKRLEQGLMNIPANKGGDTKYAHLKGDSFESRQNRIIHIMTEQLYGLPTSELTAYISRRTLYGSVDANGPLSFASRCSYDEDGQAIRDSEGNILDSKPAFSVAQGNIRYIARKHSWVNGYCKYCRVSIANEAYDDNNKDNFAYSFIHTENIVDELSRRFLPSADFKRGKRMDFDIIVGAPPHSLTISSSDDEYGNARKEATPIYTRFVDAAISANPRFILMATPSKWMTGGRGLDSYRKRHMSDTRYRIIHDYKHAKSLFPSAETTGGAMFFLWDSEYYDKTEYWEHEDDNPENAVMNMRYLDSGISSVVIRESKGVDIIKRMKEHGAYELGDLSSVVKNDMYGIKTNAVRRNPELFSEEITDEFNIQLHVSQKESKKGYVYVQPKTISNAEQTDRYQVLVASVGDKPNSSSPTTKVIFNPILVKPSSACSSTFVIAGRFKYARSAHNYVQYLRTKLVRFLIMQKKHGVTAYASVYEFVPRLNFADSSHSWDDAFFCGSYSEDGKWQPGLWGLTEDDWNYIDSKIETLESTDITEDDAKEIWKDLISETDGIVEAGGGN